MGDQARDIAIVIGVASSVPNKYLSGAVNGANAFATWAKAQKYETLLVTDESGDVTMPILRARIEDILQASNAPIHRIIVYFAGHGLIRELEEGLWLLSDWRKELRAVAVEVLKRRLTMYGPQQICIMSDACRSLPANVDQADLVPDSVLGAGPRSADPTVAIDKFIAAQDGTEAFMIPANDPDGDRCLFSGVLIEGLWGLPGLTLTAFSKREPDRITSQSLGSYLKSEVSARAQNYELQLIPAVLPTFPEADDYYFIRTAEVVPPAFPPWPPKGPLKIVPANAGLERADNRHEVFHHRDWAGNGDGDGAAASFDDGDTGGSFDSSRDGAEDKASDDRSFPPTEGVEPIRLTISEQLQQQKLPTSPEWIYGQWRSGIGVSDATGVRLWLRAGAEAKHTGVDAASWRLMETGQANLSYPAPSLIEFPDGKFGALCLLPDFFTSVVRDDFGMTGLVYRELLAGEGARDINAPVEQALDALESGAIRSEQASDWAADLRRFKHADPVLGVIAAYLYDAVGDVENIRRMASYYAMYGEAIPYDIALLAALTARRTEHGFEVDVPAIPARAPKTETERRYSWTHSAMGEITGCVGGLWPWMRQGWTFLDDPTDVGSPLVWSPLIELRAGLMRSRFATLEPNAGRELARLCGLRRVDI